MRDDPETAHLDEQLPEDPELLPENQCTWDIWQIVRDQVRVGYCGAFALDLGVAIMLLERRGVDDLEWELRKMNKLFYETHKKE